MRASPGIVAHRLKSLRGGPPLADDPRERPGDRLGPRMHEDVPSDRAPDRSRFHRLFHPLEQLGILQSRAPCKDDRNAARGLDAPRERLLVARPFGIHAAPTEIYTEANVPAQ